jgi:hypothetical protein
MRRYKLSMKKKLSMRAEAAPEGTPTLKKTLTDAC